VIIVPLVFEFRNELSAALRLEDVMYALRIVACKGTEDLPWRSGYIMMGHYPVLPGLPGVIGQSRVMPAEQRQQ
jgi:hypothetical protein